MSQETILLLVNLLLLASSSIWVNWDFVRHYKTFWEAIKGDDKVLQPHEIVIYIYVRILPIVILSDLFFDYTVEEEVWYSLDAIFFALIAGDLGHKYLSNKNNSTK